MAYDAAGGFFELDMGRFGELLGEELTESLEALLQNPHARHRSREGVCLLLYG
ncbi:hypothetical protein [Paenibacillus sp. P32E]|uniref:hypothetical protein n=1 Tax=Paenibacillus sp. P32E TaxID=1349434 RepID=UPI0015BB1989|nr:hypothetical protein [Paenibacillus sp. P32E]